jgi:hypothetical protein
MQVGHLALEPAHSLADLAPKIVESLGERRLLGADLAQEFERMTGYFLG